MIQALITDFLALLDVQSQCQAEHDAIAVAREYLLKQREKVLKEIEKANE